MDRIFDQRILRKEERRICKSCGKELALVEHFFYHRTNNSFSLKCKECVSNDRRAKLGRKRVYKPRTKTITRDITIEDSITTLILRYRGLDRRNGRDFGLTREFVKGALLSNCMYCGNPAVGLDRINNTIGHIDTNCVPCCALCNFTRMDKFTYEEMLILGQSIAQIQLTRNNVC